MQGNGETLQHYPKSTQVFQPGADSGRISIPVHESHWFVYEGNEADPVPATREQLMKVLADLESVTVLASPDPTKASLLGYLIKVHAICRL